MDALQRPEVNCPAPHTSIFDSFEKIDNSDAERLGQQVQACQGQIHLATLEGPHLRTMETALIGKHVLAPAFLHSQIANPVPQTPLQFLPLHFQQFGGTLRKHILLMRRGTT